MPDLPGEEETITKEIKACILSDDVCDEMDECNHDGGEEAIQMKQIVVDGNDGSEVILLCNGD